MEAFSKVDLDSVYGRDLQLPLPELALRFAEGHTLASAYAVLVAPLWTQAALDEGAL